MLQKITLKISTIFENPKSSANVQNRIKHTTAIKPKTKRHGTQILFHTRSRLITIPKITHYTNTTCQCRTILYLHCARKKLATQLFFFSKTVLRWKMCLSFLWILWEEVSIDLFCPEEIGSRDFVQKI